MTCGVWHGACIPGVYDVILPHTGTTVEELPFGARESVATKNADDPSELV